MGIRGLTHKERRERLARALAEIEAGAHLPEVATAYGYSRTSLITLRKRAASKPLPIRKPKPPKPYKPTKRERIARRDAQVIELHALGINRLRMAELLRVSNPCIYQTGWRLGLTFVHAGTGSAPEQLDKAATMAALYRDGYTLQRIADQYGITRERVRQMMTKHFGIRHADGGQATAVAKRREKAAQERDAQCLARWGCTFAQLQQLRALKKPTRAYGSQRSNAKKRGIEWHLTLWQWWTIWQASGHWDHRGRGQGYVMCRKGDVGPYAVGNVFIAPAVQNSADAAARRKRDPSLPIGVKRTPSGKYLAQRNLNGQKLRLGTHDTPDLAYAAYLRAAVTVGVAA